jgi:hypothetical protein
MPARVGRAVGFTVLILVIAVLVLDFGAEIIAAPAMLGLSPKDQLAELTSVRTMLVQVLGGLVLLGGLAYTSRTFRLSERGHIADRYTKAVEQLASQQRSVRAGGVYALERIMHDSERDHETVVEVLASFLQEQAKPGADPRKSGAQEEPPARRLRPPADVAAAVAALRRRPQRKERSPLDLAGAYLVGADLEGANLNNADLRDADLRYARLAEAQLQNTQMHRVKLRGAWLTSARLDGAYLHGASLPAAHMSKATLRGASLVGVEEFQSAWLDDADLGEAQLWDTRLRGVLLARTKFHGATLHGADLRDTDLSRVDGLTQEQIGQAHCDETTALPPELFEPTAEDTNNDETDAGEED